MQPMRVLRRRTLALAVAGSAATVARAFCASTSSPGEVGVSASCRMGKWIAVDGMLMMCYVNMRICFQSLDPYTSYFTSLQIQPRVTPTRVATHTETTAVD